MKLSEYVKLKRADRYTMREIASEFEVSRQHLGVLIKRDVHEVIDGKLVPEIVRRSSRK